MSHMIFEIPLHRLPGTENNGALVDTGHEHWKYFQSYFVGATKIEHVKILSSTEHLLKG